MYVDLATRCAEDAASPGKFDLLGLSGSKLARFKVGLANAALMDLQTAMDRAWESGEVGPIGEQLALLCAA